MHDLEKVLTSQYLKRIVFNKMSQSEVIFYLSVVRSTQYSQNIVLNKDLEKVLTSLLLMLHIRDSAFKNISSIYKFMRQIMKYFKYVYICQISPYLSDRSIFQVSLYVKYVSFSDN